MIKPKSRLITTTKQRTDGILWAYNTKRWNTKIIARRKTQWKTRKRKTKNNVDG